MTTEQQSMFPVREELFDPVRPGVSQIERDLLRWVYKLSREALFERTHRSAGKSALAALSEINHKLAPYK